jgi:hypothetical protein
VLTVVTSTGKACSFDAVMSNDVENGDSVTVTASEFPEGNPYGSVMTVFGPEHIADSMPASK